MNNPLMDEGRKRVLAIVEGKVDATFAENTRS